MSYQVLARKYRPQTFDEIVGQDAVVRTLKNAIQAKRIAHAFLFVGPRGIGKTSTARVLAKALNCPGGPTADFNPDDEVCQEIAEGRSLDVIEIDGASNNSVDHIRDLRDNVRYTPTKGNFKIYIIDEVHMLTSAAFNALLKTLEEPPAHVKFIFATTEPHKVLPTILSRCQRFDLKRLSEEDIAAQLKKIVSSEKIKADDTALRLIARQAEGGMRDAESALDQLISFCGNTIKEKDVLQMFALTSGEEIRELGEAVLAGNEAQTLEHARALAKSERDLVRLTQDLLRHFRNFLLYRISPDIAREELSEEEESYFKQAGAEADKRLLLGIIEELTQLEAKIRFALVKEVFFEIGMIRIASQKQKVSLEGVLKVLAGGETLPSPAPAPKPVMAHHPKPKEKTPEPAPVAASPSAPPSEPKKKTAPASINQSDFQNDPLIQSALEQFQARIVEVRE